MKRTLALGLAAVLVVALPGGGGAPRPAPARESLILSGAWALYPLAVRWKEEFTRTRPRIDIDVQAGGAGKGITDVLAGIVDIGMVSREILPVEFEKGAVALPVAKDAVVATISRKNPFLETLLRRFEP